MRQFFWRIVICFTPCLLAGWVTTVAVLRYYRGESGGFKMGVDLVGGTILVYEIDTRKQLEQDRGNPQRDTQLLAESLKRRIDPTDTYNIMIRPAGGEGRVEIILPTGGTHRTKAAEEAWKSLIASLEEEYELHGKLEVPRGRVQELAEAIQLRKARQIWESDKVFGSSEGWKRLLDATFHNEREWPQLHKPAVTPAVVANVVAVAP